MESGTVHLNLKTVLLTMMMFKWGTLCSATSDRCLSAPCQNGATCVDDMDDYACICPRDGVRYMGKTCHELYDACAFSPCEDCTSIPGTTEYHCTCPDGLAGDNCTEEVDECESGPCSDPHSACIDQLNGYFCRCPAGYGGEDCQSQVTDCVDEPCQNNATCVLLPEGFACQCAPGFMGDACEEDVDECSSHPCQNGAICVDGVGEFYCFCVPGFQGYNCEMDINECASRPCKNNATCINGRDHYECDCLIGFAGVNCEVEIDECESSPCLNEATCHDLIGEYVCECVDGFDGTQCEINIDECASDPCQNEAVCHDMVNSYECDCGDTGFMGTHCEEDIPECASDPCQHGATCLEGLKQYICLCWPGYEGEHCEIDIDECAASPCENGAECLQRSDPSSWETDWEFHFSDAAGYICHCQPGYAGENCSVDMDECESEPCQNAATCEDQVNGYVCTCSDGFTGDMCEVNIDECESQPCHNGGRCEDGVASYACRCPEPEGPGDLPWGGDHCQVQLHGCVDHECQNGATCQPWLDGDDHSHGHDCLCAHGFYDEHCSTPTTFSLRALGFVRVEVEAPEEEREIRDVQHHHRGDDHEPGGVRLRFRTTLPNMVLFYRGDADNHMLLEIESGSLHAKALSEDAELLVTFPEPVTDGGWWDAHVFVEEEDDGGLVLIVRGPGCDGDPQGCRVADGGGPDGPAFHPSSDAFVHVYVAGAPEELLGLTATGQSFMGCMEDLLIDHNAILPHELTQEDQIVELGCSKTEWCSPDPCSGNGRCVDLWTSYHCDCYRPYHGESCSDEFPSWTYSHEDSLSFSSYVVAEEEEEGHSGGDFSVSLFLRSLKPDGLLFQLRRHHTDGEEEEEEGEAYFSLYLGMGRVFVSSLADGVPVTAPIFMTTGEKRFLQVDVQHGQVFFQHGDLRYAIGSVPAVAVSGGDVAYVGGLPAGWSTEPWGGAFKGCLQDLRLDAARLEAEPWDGSDDEEVHSHEHEQLMSGCVSDDTCKEDPCLNGGQCGITFNDFTCLCPEEYTGKTCETRVWCVSDPCVHGGYCMDLADGYECVYSATFDNNPVRFSAEGTLVEAVTSLYIELRTRSENAVLLRATRGAHGSGSGADLLMVGLLDSALHVELHAGNSVEALVFTGRRRVSDGSWHRVTIATAKPASEVSRWVITVDGITDGSSPPGGPAVDLGFLNEEDAVFAVADSFSGCLGAVRVGGVYLPYVDDRQAPQNAQFHVVGDGKVNVGCTSAPVCDSNPCQNAATCEDLFNQYGCVCPPGWEGELCQVDTDDCASFPCVHGTCEDRLAGFRCACHAGYGGELCDQDLDECERHACQHGATCEDGPNAYTCHCPDEYSGPLCQWDYPPLQCGTDVQCDNDGVCNEGPWGANCSCVPGFAGDSCETEVDECASNPCRNGGSCLDRLDKFLCLCTPGYIGPMCDTNKQAQRERAPWLVIAIPLACLCVLIVVVAVSVMVMTARKKRQSEGAYSPSAQELAGARLEMDSMLKVPPEERLI